MIRAILFISIFLMQGGALTETKTSSIFKLSDNIVIVSSEEGQVESAPDNLSNEQIADYIRNIYQDKNGNFWFGTNGLGVAHYDGDSISYYSLEQGFAGYQITGIAEDLDQNIWFATDQGIVHYDWSPTLEGKKRFTNYDDQEYFGRQRFWSVTADSKGHIWAGSPSCIFKYNGIYWSSFDLPYPDEEPGEFITKRTTWSIIEDSKGNMWFSTNGYGVYKFDGRTFTQYTMEDGLTDNSVDVIVEDHQGQMWFGTRYGGVSRFDGDSFTNYTARDGKSIYNDEVCEIYEDVEGHIWMSSEGYGVYRFDGKQFINYSQHEGLGVRAVQAIYQDRIGRIWVGGGGGLYRFLGGSFFNVTKDGPWQ